MSRFFVVGCVTWEGCSMPSLPVSYWFCGHSTNSFLHHIDQLGLALRPKSTYSIISSRRCCGVAAAAVWVQADAYEQDEGPETTLLFVGNCVEEINDLAKTLMPTSLLLSLVLPRDCSLHVLPCPACQQSPPSLIPCIKVYHFRGCLLDHVYFLSSVWSQRYIFCSERIMYLSQVSIP